MFINREILQSSGAAVDYAQQVSLSRLKLELGQTRVAHTLVVVRRKAAVEIHFSVNEIVVRIRRHPRVVRAHDAVDDIFIFWMKPCDCVSPR